jgi:hypothetical protein
MLDLVELFTHWHAGRSQVSADQWAELIGTQGVNFHVPPGGQNSDAVSTSRRGLQPRPPLLKSC